MQVIPVLDLRDGIVVHARHGQRDRYQPLRSRLCAGSRPLDVAAGLRALHPFSTLYIADLDAIERRGDNRAAIAAIAAAHPGLGLWVDAGFAGAEAVEAFLAAGGADAVLGSESLAGTGALTRLTASAAWRRVVLSLDFRDGFMGPPDLLDQPAGWPARVIAMTLARVGSGAGPDLERLQALRRAAPGCALFAAGGVRDAADLAALRTAGISGALVATALHEGRIDGGDLARLAE